MKDLIGLLEQLNIHPHKTLYHNHKGQVAKNTYGSSDDFLNFKVYEPGDSLHRIDWKHYAKNQTLYTKKYGDEQNFRVVIALDNSQSMVCKDYDKKAFQQRLAKAIAYNALYLRHDLTLVDMAKETARIVTGDFSEGLATVELWLEQLSYTEHPLPLTSGFYEHFKSVLFILISDGWHKKSLKTGFS